MELVKLAGPLILAFIMLTLGMGLTLDDFKKVVSYPKDFFIGALSQVILFPILVSSSSHSLLDEFKNPSFIVIANFAECVPESISSAIGSNNDVIGL